jgi:pimeloyl-ACP methyl ester carboxylesterase
MDTGHFPHEENPRQFNELLITWLHGEQHPNSVVNTA